MRFITECELRQLYRQEAFTSYALSKQARLTPEASQFLRDRRITIVEIDEVKNNTERPTSQIEIEPLHSKESLLGIDSEFDCIEAQLYLLQAKSAAMGNTSLLEALSPIRRKLDDIRFAIHEKSKYDSNPDGEKSNETREHYSVYSYAITHVQAETIANLSILRAMIKRLGALLYSIQNLIYRESYEQGIQSVVIEIEGIIRGKVGGF